MLEYVKEMIELDIIFCDCYKSEQMTNGNLNIVYYIYIVFSKKVTNSILDRKCLFYFIQNHTYMQTNLPMRCLLTFCNLFTNPDNKYYTTN